VWRAARAVSLATIAIILQGVQTAQASVFHNNCTGYAMESSDRGYEKYQDRLPRSEINGVSFPRTGRIQYRGTPGWVDQFTVTSVLRAIGGDPTPTIGSRLFSVAQAVLVHPERLTAGSPILIERETLGLPTPFSPDEKALINHGILSRTQSLLACQASYSERDADIYAKDLAIKALRNLESNLGGAVTKYLFAYNTPEFAAYGDGAWDHIYSTAYPSIANGYGSKVLVFANVANKTLDLNYWNFRENQGLWSAHDADRSEFVTAIEIAPEAVIGMWKTDEAGRDKIDRDKTMRPRALSFALMRLDSDGVHYGVILDARAAAGCVMQVRSHFEGCHDRISHAWTARNIYQVSQIEFGPPIPDGKPLPVIAVVRACPAKDASCAIPNAMFAAMPRATIGLTSEERREISDASFRIDGRLFVQRLRETRSPQSSTDEEHK